MSAIEATGVRAHAAIFFAVVLLLCGWHRSDGGNDNCVSRGLMVQAIVETGSLQIDPWHDLTGDKSLIDGHYYSDKAPLPALVMVPFWWAAVHGGWKSSPPAGERSYDLLRMAGFLVGSVPFAIIVFLFWQRARRSHGAISPVLLATLPFFGSFLFVFSGSFFAHLMAAALLLGAWIAIERDRPILAGALGAAAVCCEYPLVIFPAYWGLLWLLRRKWPHVLRMAAGALPFIVLLLVYNHALTGNAFSIGYDHEAHYQFMDDAYGFGLPRAAALWGLSFSDYRGLFFYMPVLLPALVAAITTRTAVRSWYDPIVVPSVLFFLVICSYGMWWGGWSYGPRHLSAVAVLLAWQWWPALSRVLWMRWPIMVLGIAGLVLAMAAKLTCWFGVPTDARHPLTEVIGKHLREGWYTDQHLLNGWGVPVDTGAMIYCALFIVAIGFLLWMDRRTARPLT